MQGLRTGAHKIIKTCTNELHVASCAHNLFDLCVKISKLYIQVDLFKEVKMNDTFSFSLA